MFFFHCLFVFQDFHVLDSATFSICPGGEQSAVKYSSIPCWDLMPDIGPSVLDSSLLQKQILLGFSPAAGADSSQCWSLPATVRQEFPRQSVAVPFGNFRENGFCTRYFIYVNILVCLSVLLFMEIPDRQENSYSAPHMLY